MHLSSKTGFLLATFAALGLAALPARAQIATFDLTYSGASFGNGATATGTITLDESKVAPIGGHGFYPDGFIVVSDNIQFETALTLTVTGANVGNGTFTLDDFSPSAYFLNQSGTLDFSKELVGQDGFTDFNLFNRLGASPDAPDGLTTFIFRTDAGQGDELMLTSFRPAAPVPEGSTTASFGLLLALGLGGVVIAKRKKSGKA